MESKSVSTLSGTIVAAILASSCCIGPLILAGLGISSIGIFSSLEKYRLLFMITTFAFIGMAFYLTYRKKKGTDACCEIKMDRIKKIALWVITVIAVGLLFSPLFLWGFWQISFYNSYERKFTKGCNQGGRDDMRGLHYIYQLCLFKDSGCQSRQC